jgi:FMN phosphatase YigB (HAD superfamily)
MSSHIVPNGQLALLKNFDIVKSMKTILIDAVNCFVGENGEIFKEMQNLLETFPNKKIILTGANYEKYPIYNLDKMLYEVFTLQHNPEKTDPKYYETMLSHFNLTRDDVIYFEHGLEAVKSAQSLGINTYFYDNNQKDLMRLKKFIDNNLTIISQ